MKNKPLVSPDDDRIRLERQAILLSKYCPVDRLNPATCPLSNLRLLGVRERRTWVQGLTFEELQYLVLYHTGCASERKRTAAASSGMRLAAAQG